MLFLRKIFGNKDAGSTNSYLTRMNATFYQLAEKCNSYVWDSLREEIMAVEEKRIDMVFESLNDKRVTPESYIKQIIYNVCSNKAESGTYHIYRGMLGPQGEEYLKITKFLLKDLTKDGVCTEAWAKEQLSYIYRGH